MYTKYPKEWQEQDPLAETGPVADWFEENFPDGFTVLAEDGTSTWLTFVWDYTYSEPNWVEFPNSGREEFYGPCRLAVVKFSGLKGIVKLGLIETGLGQEGGSVMSVITDNKEVIVTNLRVFKSSVDSLLEDIR